MSRFKTIEIDFDVHKCIETERRSFDEPPNTALRRLLKLPEVVPDGGYKETDLYRRPWSEDDVSLPHGTPIRLVYNRGRQKFEGRVENGKLMFGSIGFDSVSGAASHLARTRKGERTKLNGWLYVQYKEPGSSQWVPLNDLRQHGRSGEIG